MSEHQRLQANIDAVAILEVRKNERRILAASADQLPDLLEELQYLASDRFGEEVRLELLSVLYTRAGAERLAASPVAASEISALARKALPGGYVSTVSEAQVNLCSSAAAIGTCLAYDGALYTNSLLNVDSGAKLLWYILRFGAVNKHTHIKKLALEAFETALDGARRNSRGVFHDAVRWLQFMRADGLAVDDADMPEMPMDIDERIARLRAELKHSLE